MRNLLGGNAGGWVGTSLRPGIPGHKAMVEGRPAGLDDTGQKKPRARRRERRDRMESSREDLIGSHDDVVRHLLAAYQVPFFAAQFLFLEHRSR
ncbi:MAG TPA: hypothetical protein VEC06_21450 [Paucimonas sp.]|nr:hypothetical protein [Paucimonas sp.]